jgi:hypothetical protein
MRLSKIKWWLPPLVMAAALPLDLLVLHLPIASFAAMGFCVAGAFGQWGLGSRRIAIGIFLIGTAGVSCAQYYAGQLAQADSIAAKTVATAVAAYTLGTGQAPLKLDDLVPKYLTKLPETRSPLIGRIRYDRKTDKEWCVWWGNVHDWAGIECNDTTTYKKRSSPASSSARTVTGLWRRIFLGE